MILFILVAFTALSLGFFIYLNPERTIKMQIDFYRLINWKIEPISMTMEIRNTRWMGLSLITMVILSIIYYLRK